MYLILNFFKFLLTKKCMIVAQDFEVGKSFVLNVRTSSEVRVMKFINVIEVIKLAV